jgi:hypothetical protein
MADIGDIIDGLRVAGPSAKPKQGMKDIQHILDSTPLFMRELPENSEDNPMLEALKSLVFDGEGDGELSWTFTSSFLTDSCSRDGLEL